MFAITVSEKIAKSNDAKTFHNASDFLESSFPLRQICMFGISVSVHGSPTIQNICSCKHIKRCQNYVKHMHIPVYLYDVNKHHYELNSHTLKKQTEMSASCHLAPCGQKKEKMWCVLIMRPLAKSLIFVKWEGEKETLGSENRPPASENTMTPPTLIHSSVSTPPICHWDLTRPS